MDQYGKAGMVHLVNALGIFLGLQTITLMLKNQTGQATKKKKEEEVMTQTLRLQRTKSAKINNTYINIKNK